MAGRLQVNVQRRPLSVPVQAIKTLVVEVAGDRIFALTKAGGFGTLVFLHGQFGTSRVMLPMAQPLLEKFKCLIPDLRGRGKSVCADEHKHSWPQYSEDVIALLDEADAETAVLIGVSMGAGLAIASTLRHPERIRALALVSSPYAGSEAGWTPGQLEIQTTVLETARRVTALGPERAFPSGEVPEKWRRHDLMSIAAAITGMGLAQPFEDRDQLGSIKAPVFIASGSDDLHPAEVSALYESSFGSTSSDDVGSLSERLAAFLAGVRW